MLLAAAPANAQQDLSEAHVRTGAAVSALIPGGTARVTFVLGGIVRGASVSDRLVCITIATAGGRDHGCADTGSFSADALLNAGTVDTTFVTQSGTTLSARLTLYGYGSYVVERPLTLTLDAASAALRVTAKAIRNASVSGIVTSSEAGGGALMPGSGAVMFHGGGASVASQQPQTTRDSVSTGGIQAMGESFRGTISADGRYVAFESNAANLVAGDTNLGADVFVRDRLAGVTSRVSLSSRGFEAPVVRYATISADGRYTVFYAILEGIEGIYVHDLATRQTIVAATVTPFATPQASGDARYIAFVNEPGSAPSVIDLHGGRTVRIADCGLECGQTSGVAIAADGSRIAWTSNGSGYLPGDTNGGTDVFVRDLPDGPVVRVSVAAGGGQANGPSSAPAITPDGRFVAFASSASNLVDGDDNGATDVFVRDLLLGTTTLASVAASGARPGIGAVPAQAPSISADGGIVGFAAATPLVPEDINGLQDVFIRDLRAQRTVRASVSEIGMEPDGPSTHTSLSADGTTMMFPSAATNLVLPDGNGGAGRHGFDVYTRYGEWGG